MFTRYRRAVSVSAPVSVEAPPDTNNLATSLADTSISVNVTSASVYVPLETANNNYNSVSDFLRLPSPIDPAPDTPTITRILLSTLDGVQCGVPTLTTPTLTPTTLRNIQQTFLQASASQVQPPETHTYQAGFVPPFVHPQPGSTFISIDSKSLVGGIATLVEPSTFAESELAQTLSKDGLGLGGGGPPPLLPISCTFTTNTSSSYTGLPIISSIGGVNLPVINNNNNININTSTISCSSSSLAPLPGPASPSAVPPSTSPMPSVSLYSSDSDTMHSTDAPPSRRMGGRRPNNSEKLSDEEAVKRNVRRERNKMAAARCRKRRLDQTMTLQEETDHLEEKKASIQQEITLLQQQREELEFLLATHKAVCTRASRTKPSSQPSTVIVTTSSMRLAPSATIIPVSMHQEPVTSVAQNVFIKEENVSDSEEMYGNSLFGSIIPDNSNIRRYVNHIPTSSLSIVPSTTTSFRDRTTNFGSKPNRPTSLNVAPLTDIGVSIETPSTGLRGLNFESMMDGGTGLTPVTPLTGPLCSMSTGLTPLTTPIVAHPSASIASGSSIHCGYQQRSSSSELSSPDSMSSKHLVSL